MCNYTTVMQDLEHVEPYSVAVEMMKPGNGDKLIVLHVYTSVETISHHQFYLAPISDS
jgi:hypothetical protein